MYHKCKASGADEFNLRGAIVEDISEREKTTLLFRNVLFVLG